MYSYIAASSDIITKKLDTLSNNIQQSLSNVELLVNQVNKSLKLYASLNIPNEISIVFHKINSLYNTMKDVKQEIENTKLACQQINDFFASDKLLDDLKKYSKLYVKYFTFYKLMIFNSLFNLIFF